MKATVLLAAPEEADREAMKAVLGPNYRYLEAENREEIYDTLEQAGLAVSAIVLDSSRSLAPGRAVLEGLRRHRRGKRIPILVLAGAVGEREEETLLALGAMACVRQPYSHVRLRALLENAVRLCGQAASEEALRWDKLTGLYTREAFFAEAERMIRSRRPGYYVLSCLNVDSFKIINEQYGEAQGDEVLRHVGSCFYACVRPWGGICCRHLADQFALLYPAQYMDSAEIIDCRREAEAPACIRRRLRIRIGRSVVDDPTLPVSSLYNRAVMAEESIRGRYDVHVADYRESMREHLLREQKIVSEMMDALRGGQFEVWFQPQYNHAAGALLGAEALVRWRRPEDGQLILPGTFIPAFERSGFIYELDKYVWEQVCALLRRWLDEGRQPLPISVNVSRQDVLMTDFLDVLTGLVARYDIPIELLRLEITESAFSQCPEQIVSVIKKLTALGFTVEIDDFGSGYSSLNTLKDVPAQVVKLDMRFLGKGEDFRRGGNILESVVRMVKWLDMAVIAEGVETRAQADYLKSIGCFYVQGFLYARPMPDAAYEALAWGAARTEPRLESLRTVRNLSTNDFWDPDSIDTLIFNTFVGGACILEVHGRRIEVLRANDKYIRELGSAGMTLSDALKLDWAAHMSEDSRRRFFAALEDSIATENENDGEYLFYRLPGGGERTYLRVTLRVIATSRDRYLTYCLIENTTQLRAAEEKERRAEQKRRAAAEQLEAIMNSVSESITATLLTDGKPRILFTNEQFYQVIGYTREQYLAEVAGVYDFIYPEDRAGVAEAMSVTCEKGLPLSLFFRVVRRDGAVRRLRGHLSMIRLPGVEDPVQLGVSIDVTDQLAAEQRERELAARLQIILGNINGGVSAVTFERGVPRYVFANSEFYAMFGYTREQFEAELPNGLLDRIHPEDLPAVRQAAQENPAADSVLRMEYRVRRRDGRELWVHSSCSVHQMAGIGAPVHLSVLVDITGQKEAEEHFRFLNEMAHEILARPEIEPGIDGMLRRLLDFFRGDRAYLFEYHRERDTVSNTYEACAAGIQPEIDRLQEVPAAAFPNWTEAFQRMEQIDIPDVRALPGESAGKALLLEQGIHSIVSVPLIRGGRVIGFLGVDNPRRNHRHVKRLFAVGDYVSVMLTRREDEKQLARQVLAQEQMMQDIPGGFARVQVTKAGIVPIFINEELCRLCGMTHAKAMRLYADDASAAIHPADLFRTRALLRQAIAERGAGFFRVRLLHGDGGYRPMEVFFRVTEDPDGNLFVNGYYSDAAERDGRKPPRGGRAGELPAGSAGRL